MDINNINWKKEIVDQFAHFTAGVIPVLIFSYLGLNVYLSAVIVMVFAVAREIKQRLDRKDKWYGCSWGCRTDLFFWFIGVNVGILGYYIYIH